MRNTTPGIAGDYLGQVEGSEPTKNQALAALRKFFDAMVQRHAVALNPFASVAGAVSTAQVYGTASHGESTNARRTVTVGGVPAMVTFSGLAPGSVSLNQVSVMVPSVLAGGNQAVVMNGVVVASNSVLRPITR